MAQRSGINRPFSWLKKVMQVTEETSAPSVLSEKVRPTMDVFGWERFQEGPVTENIAGALAADIVLLPVVPEGVLRYVMFASVMHDDPVAGGLTLSIQIRTPVGAGSFDIGIGPAVATPIGPVKMGTDRPFLLQPGQTLLCRTTPAPAAGQRVNNLSYRFVDLDFGEYFPAV